MILIQPDTWLEHWHERKKQPKDTKEKVTDQLPKDEESTGKKILVECGDLFICVNA